MSETIIEWRYPVKSDETTDYIAVPEILYVDEDIPEWNTYVDQLSHYRDSSDSSYVEYYDFIESENGQQEELDLEDDYDVITNSEITGETLLDIGLCQRVQPLLHDMYIANNEENYDDKSDIETENASADQPDFNAQLDSFMENDQLTRKYIIYQKNLLEAIDSNLKNLKNTSKQNSHQLQADVEEFINKYDDIWKKISANKNESKIGVINKEIENEINDLQQGNCYKRMAVNSSVELIAEKMIDRLKSHLESDQNIAKPISLYGGLIESIGKEYIARRILIICISQVYKYNYAECNHLSLLAINDGYYENFLINSKKYILSRSPIVVEMYLYGCIYNLAFMSPVSEEQFKHSVAAMRKLVRSMDKYNIGLERYKDHKPKKQKSKKYKSKGHKLKDHKRTDYKGCFGIMEFDNQHRYFSFSGVHDAIDPKITSIPDLCKIDYKKRIDELVKNGIKQSGRLSGFEQAICTVDVCSYTRTTNGIVGEKLEDVIAVSPINTEAIKNDYSCCERKMFALFNDSLSRSSRHEIIPSGGYIFAKLKPCKNCRLAIEYMESKGFTFKMYYSSKGTMKQWH